MRLAGIRNGVRQLMRLPLRSRAQIDADADNELASMMQIGTVVSWGVSRTLGSLLFGVSPTDPISFTAMLVMLTVVAVASGYLPARRAARVDPITALRGT